MLLYKDDVTAIIQVPPQKRIFSYLENKHIRYIPINTPWLVFLISWDKTLDPPRYRMFYRRYFHVFLRKEPIKNINLNTQINQMSLPNSEAKGFGAICLGGGEYHNSPEEVIKVSIDKFYLSPFTSRIYQKDFNIASSMTICFNNLKTNFESYLTKLA
jgi:hypothetical protein